MGPVVVHDDVDVEITRDVRLDEVEEFAELSGPMARETFADDLSRGDVEGREERGRAVALVVVAAPLRLPGRIGKRGWERSRAWIWLFSSTQRTRARSGGAKYRPTMSRTFSTKKGSLDSLKFRAMRLQAEGPPGR